MPPFPSTQIPPASSKCPPHLMEPWIPPSTAALADATVAQRALNLSAYSIAPIFLRDQHLSMTSQKRRRMCHYHKENPSAKQREIGGNSAPPLCPDEQVAPEA
ncbi:MAG: hypothetical protein M1829_006879 [Trizodia sp. TS-e1964]|nr:MAG: hypothetical protein M1829_006879 [Trizodia sp. TS-e1964]